MYSVGEDDEILNDIVEGDISKEEILNKIKYDNLNYFLNYFLNNLNLKNEHIYSIL